MRKILPLLAFAFLAFTFIFSSCKNQPIYKTSELKALSVLKKKPGYDAPALRDSLNFLKIKDPALGYVPTQRIFPAIDITADQKNSFVSSRTTASLTWTERGPIFDTVGPSNGNTRGGGRGVPDTYTSGRMRGVLFDTLNDATGNTVFAGGVSGGLWKCTNFLSSNPTWVAINDRFENLAISSICQDPSTPSIMYFSTGEPTSNADAVFGGGIWKSTNAGTTWTRLPSTTNFIRNFKILCDAAGNVYLAARVTTSPASQPFGLQRSKDKGLTWTNITPTGLTSNAHCTDIELSSSGRLHASFGYLGTIVNHRYTSDPANVVSAGWNIGAGIRTTSTAATRLEMAVQGNILYGITVNTAYNADSCYKSIDGGVTWTLQNISTAYPTGILNGQGWYNIALVINPANANEFLLGGLDAYRSVNSGATCDTRVTNWVGPAPYVHADHHFMDWRILGAESRIVIGCDGGIYLSRDNGNTWSDRNKTLSIKQFYSGAIHPAAGSPYLLAGAQDNGVHQIKTPGLTSSVEVTGGDGAFVHINQKTPSVQFGSFVFNQYRRSLDGGVTWGSVNFSNSAGLFINPWDYDDTKNILYGSWGAGIIIRWTDANTTTNATTVTYPQLGSGTAASMPTAFKVSLNTADRLFIGASQYTSTSQVTKLIRVDNASTATPTVTDITGTGFPTTAYLSCVNTGATDQNLVVVFSNFGVSNVWHSTNGGTSWTAIDGNLPDMPVRWALFVPGNDNQMMIATETGIFNTDLINGSSTIWNAESGFPTVRTDMLKMRVSDNGVVAATHGRGLFTAAFPVLAVPVIGFTSASTTVTEDSTTVVGCRRYRDYTVNLGINMPPSGDATVTFNVQAGNTAVQGVDFDITTNGSFTAPSTQVTFASGATTGKTVTVRIYDDAEVESTETFTLGFTVSGSTNAIAGGIQSHTFTIIDNDAAPVAGKIATTGSRVEYLTANNDLYYYTPTRDVIARIKNLSTHNYGCTQVTIDRAGTGSTQFWNFNPANYLMNKTYQVVPATNNAAGSYEITFYYTKEEKEGWEAATGQSWNNIMLIKVPSAISNVTPLNAQPDGPGTVQIITPVRGTLGTGFTLTATISNGFSGFGAGIPGRINTILTLSGAIDANLKDINLSWTTSAEMGGVSFDVEKSYDGISFFNIGTVPASGTKLTPTTYTFVDNQNVQLNYYRVRLRFDDGSTQLSNVLFIQNDNVQQRLDVLGNPFTNTLNIRLARLPKGTVVFALYDMAGRQVLKQEIAANNLLYSINTARVVSSGVYKLSVYADGVSYTISVFKK